MKEKIKAIGAWMVEFKGTLVSVAIVMGMLATYYGQIEDWYYAREDKARARQTSDIITQVSDSVATRLEGKFITRADLLAMENRIDSRQLANGHRWNYAIDSIAVPALIRIDMLENDLKVVKNYTRQTTTAVRGLAVGKAEQESAEQKMIAELKYKIRVDSIRQVRMQMSIDALQRANKKFENLRE